MHLEVFSLFGVIVLALIFFGEFTKQPFLRITAGVLMIFLAFGIFITGLDYSCGEITEVLEETDESTFLSGNESGECCCCPYNKSQDYFLSKNETWDMSGSVSRTETTTPQYCGTDPLGGDAPATEISATILLLLGLYYLVYPAVTWVEGHGGVDRSVQWRRIKGKKKIF